MRTEGANGNVRDGIRYPSARELQGSCMLCPGREMDIVRKRKLGLEAKPIASQRDNRLHISCMNRYEGRKFSVEQCEIT